MKKNLLSLTLALFIIGLCTTTFAQMDSTMGVMVKVLEQEIYPRSVKLTVVNDSTIVAFAQSPEKNYI